MMAAVFAQYEIRVQQRHFAGLQQGIDGEDLVAQVLGAPDNSSLTPVQEVYKDKVKAKLAEVHLACALSAAALPTNVSVYVCVMCCGPSLAGILIVTICHCFFISLS